MKKYERFAKETVAEETETENTEEPAKDENADKIKALEEGTEVVNRTGTNTIKVPSHNFHFDLSKEFPILTTKQLFLRQAVLEMLWIYQAQSNDVRWLQERDVKIWNEWEIDDEGYWNEHE